MAAPDANSRNNMEDILGSFVEQKLQQHGYVESEKRQEDKMNDLEMRLKLKLERNIVQNKNLKLEKNGNTVNDSPASESDSKLTANQIHINVVGYDTASSDLQRASGNGSEMANVRNTVLGNDLNTVAGCTDVDSATWGDCNGIKKEVCENSDALPSKHGSESSHKRHGHVQDDESPKSKKSKKEKKSKKKKKRSKDSHEDLDGRKERKKKERTKDEKKRERDKTATLFENSAKGGPYLASVKSEKKSGISGQNVKSLEKLSGGKVEKNTVNEKYVKAKEGEPYPTSVKSEEKSGTCEFNEKTSEKLTEWKVEKKQNRERIDATMEKNDKLSGTQTVKKSEGNKSLLPVKEKLDISRLDESRVMGESESTKNESSVKSQTQGLKRDIATIRMKVELLKAKSESEKLDQELKSLLKLDSEKNSGDSVKVDARKRRSRSRSRSRKHSKSHSRHRSRSRSREHKSDRHRHRSRSPKKRSHRSRSNSRERRYKSKKRSRRHSPLISAKDKVRLLEIAKANALAQHRASYTAATVSSLGQIVKEGTLSVTELTSMCREIATGKESSEVLSVEPLTKESAEKMLQQADEAKVHHPFAIKEVSTLTIKPVKSLPNMEEVVQKPLATLSKEFPVSCGQQHRRKEVLETVYGKWEAVAKDESTKKAVKELVTSDKVFVEPEPVNVDLNTAIAERISAVRQLQINPTDVDAQNKMDSAQKALDNWTKSRQVPGQFTGSTGLTAMPKNVLEGGKQAWYKANDLKNAKPVVGIGKSLLQKMGWKPGMSLGKTMPGQLEPLVIDAKNDRRGLSSFMEAPAPGTAKKHKTEANVKDLSNKHPVSALMEICSKRRWPAPEFRLADPLDLKSFTFRVLICNDEYIGKPASNKKQAKLFAATVALQNLGLIPKNS